MQAKTLFSILLIAGILMLLYEKNSNGKTRVVRIVVGVILVLVGILGIVMSLL